MPCSLRHQLRAVRLRRATAFAAWLLLSAAAPLFGDEPTALQPEAADHFERSVRPVLVEHCAACHDPEDSENPVAFLTAQTLDDVATRRGLWSSVAEQLRNRTMPPADEPQPGEADRLRIAGWIDRTLRETACRLGEYAGNVTSRRLNRREYDHTIRDLLGVDLGASEAFPVDGSGGEGFDNNGETLFLPPILMERYLEAATAALDAAIVTPALAERFRAADLLPEPKDKDAGAAAVRVLAPREETTAVVTVYTAGRFTVRSNLRPHEADAATVALRVDGIAADRFRLQSGDGKPTEQEAAVRLARGVHTIAIRNVGESAVELSRLEVREDRDELADAQRASHRLVFEGDPGEQPENPRADAEAVLSRFAGRAFRRPVTDAEITRLLTLYDRAAERGDPHEEAVKLALKAVLVSPHFLFRVESEPTSSEPEPISDHELAARLSYFLWESMPDEELSRLADEGRLHERDVLLAQVDRMLADPKAHAFAESFIGQWLGTRRVGNGHAPDTSTFRDQFTFKLVFDLRKEPAHFFAHLLKEDRSLLELIDSDYAVLNRRLKIHYGLIDPPAKAGPEWKLNQYREEDGGPFHPVELPDERRGGVLGMGAVHMHTSYPHRTSPVLRGGWVLETLLGVHVPSPPPDVPELKRGKKAKQSLREQLAAHRDHAACAACHNLMDPLGFALENFDVLGRWREKDGPAPIDASATLPSGEKFTGPAGLRKVLLDRKDEFLRHLTQKMLGFALGRSLADADDCTINRITEAVQKDDYKTRTLIREIVLSTPFRMRQRTDADRMKTSE